MMQDHLAEVLRAGVLASGMSQVELARQTGIPQPRISAFIRAERAISLDAADRLAKALGMTLVYSPTLKARAETL